MEHLKELLEFSATINSSLRIEEIRKRAAEAAKVLTECEAASLLLFDEERQELYFDVALGEKADKVKSIRLKLGEGIAGWVAKERRGIILDNVREDPRFFRRADEITGFSTKNMVCLPILRTERLLGVLQAINKRHGLFEEQDLDVLLALANQVAVAIENAKLFAELRDAFYSTAMSLAEAIEKRDPYTGGHTRRVMEYSLLIARRMGLEEEEMERLRLSSILHDVGKIGVRDSILLKEGPLTEEEYEEIKRHTVVGEQILGHVRQLRDVVPGVKYHHERYDGSGYPEGKCGEEIPLLARIIAVADAFDALTTHRPYRAAMSVHEACKEIEECTSVQFDPEVTKAFLEVAQSWR